MILGLLTWSCAPARPRTPPLEPSVEIGTSTGANGGLFLQGFAMGWQARPHRLRTLGFVARGSAQPDGPFTGVLAAEARGGSWSDGRLGFDEARLSVRYAAVSGERLHAVGGAVHVHVKGTRGQQGRASAVGTTAVHVPLEAPYADAPTAVWLTGFLVDTAPSHPDGYTPQELAISLGAPVVDGDGVTFDVTVQCDAAPVPDRRQQLAAWGAQIDVEWLLVAAAGGAIHRVDVRRDLDDNLEPNETPGNREPMRVPFHVDVAPDLGSPVAGLSGFSLALVMDGPVPGRYVRALAVAIEDERHDAARGVFEAVVALQFSNIGPVPRKVRVDATAEITVLQPPDRVDVHRGRWDPRGAGAAHAVTWPDMVTMPPETVLPASPSPPAPVDPSKHDEAPAERG